MIWYEIPGFPGYRINHHGEVLSTKCSTPRVMKTWGNQQIMLRRNGRYINCTIPELMARTHLLGRSTEVSQPHHEAARTHCDQGHEFTPENTMWRWGRGGKEGGVKYRKCKRCHATYVARWRAKQKG